MQLQRHIALACSLSLLFVRPELSPHVTVPCRDKEQQQNNEVPSFFFLFR